MIAIQTAAIDPHYRRTVAVMATQMGKTAGLLNIVGQKLDDDPAPMMFVAPTQSNAVNVMEPQISSMLQSAPSLANKITKSVKRKTLVKSVAGVTLRLAWAGSPTELASQAAHTVLIDELDRMDPIKEGDQVTLAKARIATYPDGRMIITSSPTEGSVETEVVDGIERWKVAEPTDISSQIWKLWQEGTRHEWAVPCPECEAYFIPRFKLLTWPEGCTPRRALREARLTCPGCGFLIEDAAKSRMNEAGVYVAPGQTIENGVAVGDPPDSDTASFWVSGLMSPWVTWGQRASDWLLAARSGDLARVRAVLNTAFGELYYTRGQAPQWHQIKDCGQGYELGDIPAGIRKIFLTVDVQQDRLVCCVRGWGPEFESWLIQREELWGDTDNPGVWSRLDQFRDQTFGDRGINAVAVDSGYRTDQVYAWCLRHSNAYATKGRDRPTKLYHAATVEVDRRGKRLRAGVKLWHIDSGYFKAWVHDRIAWPQDQPGAWHVPDTIDEDYCRQIVSEQRIRLPSGRTQWIQSGQNHYLDCEAMQVFLAHVEGVRDLKPLSATPRVKKPRQQSSWVNRQEGKWIR